MKKRIFCLTLLYFCSHIVEGADINSPCDANNWGAYNCVQFLQQAIIDLQAQVTSQSAQLTIQSAQLTTVSNLLAVQSTLLATQSTQLAAQSVQLTSHFDQLTSHSNQLTTHAVTLNETHLKLEELQNNTVPIGFIYVQLPGQPEPYYLWDSMHWIDISSEYAGLFFRVLGEDSAEFNVTQAENSPRLTNVNTMSRAAGVGHNYQIEVLPNAAPSAGVTTGAHGNAGTWALQFQLSGGEVRPRNKAVRIWKRTG